MFVAVVAYRSVLITLYDNNDNSNDNNNNNNNSNNDDNDNDNDNAAADDDGWSNPVSLSLASNLI